MSSLREHRQQQQSARLRLAELRSSPNSVQSPVLLFECSLADDVRRSPNAARHSTGSNGGSPLSNIHSPTHASRSHTASAAHTAALKLKVGTQPPYSLHAILSPDSDALHLALSAKAQHAELSFQQLSARWRYTIVDNVCEHLMSLGACAHTLILQPCDSTDGSIGTLLCIGLTNDALTPEWLAALQRIQHLQQLTEDEQQEMIQLFRAAELRHNRPLYELSSNAIGDAAALLSSPLPLLSLPLALPARHSAAAGISRTSADSPSLSVASSSHSISRTAPSSIHSVNNATNAATSMMPNFVDAPPSSASQSTRSDATPSTQQHQHQSQRRPSLYQAPDLSRQRSMSDPQLQQQQQQSAFQVRILPQSPNMTASNHNNAASSSSMHHVASESNLPLAAVAASHLSSPGRSRSRSASPQPRSALHKRNLTLETGDATPNDSANSTPSRRKSVRFSLPGSPTAANGTAAQPTDWSALEAMRVQAPLLATPTRHPRASISARNGSANSANNTASTNGGAPQASNANANSSNSNNTSPTGQSQYKTSTSASQQSSHTLSHLTLNTVLRNPFLLASFTAYCTKIHALENIHLLQAIHYLMLRLTPAQRPEHIPLIRRMALDLYCEHCAPYATQLVNLDAECSSTLHQTIERFYGTRSRSSSKNTQQSLLDSNDVTTVALLDAQQLQGMWSAARAIIAEMTSKDVLHRWRQSLSELPHWVIASESQLNTHFVNSYWRQRRQQTLQFKYWSVARDTIDYALLDTCLACLFQCDAVQQNAQIVKNRPLFGSSVISTSHPHIITARQACAALLESKLVASQIDALLQCQLLYECGHLTCAGLARSAKCKVFGSIDMSRTVRLDSNASSSNGAPQEQYYKLLSASNIDQKFPSSYDRNKCLAAQTNEKHGLFATSALTLCGLQAMPISHALFVKSSATLYLYRETCQSVISPSSGGKDSAATSRNVSPKSQSDTISIPHSFIPLSSARLTMHTVTRRIADTMTEFAASSSAHQGVSQDQTSAMPRSDNATQSVDDFASSLMMSPNSQRKRQAKARQQAQSVDMSRVDLSSVREATHADNASASQFAPTRSSETSQRPRLQATRSHAAASEFDLSQLTVHEEGNQAQLNAKSAAGDPTDAMSHKSRIRVRRLSTIELSSQQQLTSQLPQRQQFLEIAIALPPSAQQDSHQPQSPGKASTSSSGFHSFLFALSPDVAVSQFLVDKLHLSIEQQAWSV